MSYEFLQELTVPNAHGALPIAILWQDGNANITGRSIRLPCDHGVRTHPGRPSPQKGGLACLSLAIRGNRILQDASLACHYQDNIGAEFGHLKPERLGNTAFRAGF